MQIPSNTSMDTQSLLEFYATLFRILVLINLGGLAAAVACILWLIRFDEMSPWVGPRRGQRFERFRARPETKAVKNGRVIYLHDWFASSQSQPSKRIGNSSPCHHPNA